MKTCAMHWPWQYVACLVILIVVPGGCNDAFIDPFNNDGKYYTIYGFLDQSKNFQAGATHAIRITPITRRPERIESTASPQADFDGRVFLTNLFTDLRHEMSHNLEELQPGTFGHIFRISLFLQPGHRYRLEIERSDGIITSAETQIPAVSGIATIKKAPVVTEQDALVVQEMVLTGVESLWNLDVIYYTGNCFGNSPNVVSYGRAGRHNSEGWVLHLNITEDLTTIKDRLQTSSINLCAMGLRARIIDAQWILPEGELIIDEVSLPQNLTNVEHGFGFFGSMGLFQDDWQIDSTLSELVNSDGG